MLFNSITFLLFLPITFVLYWGIGSLSGAKGLKGQNLVLLVASYVFYGWWDARFLGLIIFSTIIDYAVGIKIEKSRQVALSAEKPQKKLLPPRLWLALSLTVNLGLLLYFKYANFFIESWVDSCRAFGFELDSWSLQIILPVGISFYTFQTLSYSIDIYRNKISATTNFVEFASFVSFFPQLVAGPIERASKLLPQIRNKRVFEVEESIQGVRLILWGMFKKVFIADTCAMYVNDIFMHSDEYYGPALILGALLFALQIYGDFSGYSDIAIGTARLFGIRLMTNFRRPYFSRDIAEFWRKWHISLSTWFRDYLYIPLGGSRGNKLNTLRNTTIIFIVSGFWHGANWTFIVWGALHALFFIPLLLREKNRVHVDELKGLPSLRELFGMVSTFSLVTFAWIFFRAPNLDKALQYISRCFQWPQKLLFETIVPTDLTKFNLVFLGIGLLLLFLFEAIASSRILEKARKSCQTVEPLVWAIFVVFILSSPGLTEENTFIYFQF